jgi:hypothetical protein
MSTRKRHSPQRMPAFWMRVARATGAQPSAVTYSRLGLLVVPTSIAAALVALMLVSPHGHI